ncbi:MAG: DUF4040 domain-containing protein [Opitutales bacterium]|nr:DUF4040 domain-containing protein [Opitutales bacterium]
MIPILLTSLPLVLAVVVYFNGPLRAALTGKIAAACLLLLLGILAYVSSSPSLQHLLSSSIEWVPSLGVELLFSVNGFSRLMLFLIFGVGTVIFFYASDYLKSHPQQHRFLTVLLIFLTGMTGIVVSDNLIQLFIFWEVTSVTSYLLIGFKHEDAKSRWNALQALLVTGSGGVVLLLGFILLGSIAGSFDFQQIVQSKESILAHPYAVPAAICILIGALTKSGQFPFHFWLPNAMSAPTPVSAFLHSATMVKAGVFIVAKFTPIFTTQPYWDWPLVALGSITMLYASVMGLMQSDLKKILAYTTLAVLGLLMMLLGVGTELAVKSAIVFLLGHALYKSVLFLSAGSIDHAVHTREVGKLGGLFRWMPLTAITACLAALSKSGFPPFFGFLSKEYVYKAGLAEEAIAPFIIAMAVLTNMLLMALALKVGVHPYFSKKNSVPAAGKAHDPSPWMTFGPLMLASLGLAIGMFPAWISEHVTNPAVSTILMSEVSISMKLWHGLNLPLLLSVLTLAGGLSVYAMRHNRIFDKTRESTITDPFEKIYRSGHDGLIALTIWITGFIQSGSLKRYFIWMISFFVFLVMTKLILIGAPPKSSYETPLTLLDVSISIMMIAGMFGALITKSRLIMLLALSLVGFGIAWIFAVYSAPDLAITQILVETLIVVLFVLCIRKMSMIRSLTRVSTRVRDIALATLAGAIMTVLVLKSQWIQFAPSISEELMEWSYPLAKGKNVVNVILVDFRALDTFGEIIVLGIAALGVGILVTSNRSKSKEKSSNTP